MRRVILSIAMVLSIFLMFANVMVYAAGGRYGSKLCHADPDNYKCYTTKRRDSWQSLFPDENQRITAKKVNRMGNSLYGGIVIAIPISFGESYMDHAPFPLDGDATGNKHIVISISKLAFGAYDETGKLISWGPVSTAKGYCPDLHHGCHTPTGDFAVYNKGGSDCKSRKFPIGRGGAPMPYCMFFHGGFAMHGSYDVPGGIARWTSP